MLNVHRLVVAVVLVLLFGTIVTIAERSSEATGRWKSDGNGGCYWDANDEGPDQCDPNSPSGRWKISGETCYWDSLDTGPNQCEPNKPLRALVYCLPVMGCGVGVFYWEQVTVVGNIGYLDIGATMWGWRECEGCELEDPHPLPAPEPLSSYTPPTACGDVRDVMVQEYKNYGVYWIPACTDFKATNVRFAHTEDTHAPYAFIREDILYNALGWIQEHSFGDLNVTSAYRCPHNNASLPNAAKQSRHMFGDAMDLKPPSSVPLTEANFNIIRNAALGFEPGYITEWSTYSDRHLHVDWRGL